MKKKLIAILAVATVMSTAGALAACSGGHQHKYDANKWVNTDPEYHWNECTADGCDDKQQNKAAHDTNGTDGSCSVCGYKPNSSGGETPTEKTDAEKLLDGYFTFGFETTDNGTQVRFFHFYEDTVYFGSGDTKLNQVTADNALSYSVAEKDYAYTVWTDRDERVQDRDGGVETHAIKGTAKYTITMTEFDGSASYTVGYDGTYIYVGDVELINGVSDYKLMRFDHDAEGNGSHSSVCKKESGKKIQELFKKDTSKEEGYDETVFLEINHNGTYIENVTDEDGTMGKWTSTVSGDVITYTLTPNDTAKKVVTLVVNGDDTATFTPAGGTAVDLVAPAKPLVVLVTLEGVAKGMMPNPDPDASDKYINVDLPTTLNLYSDKKLSWELIMNMAGTDMPVAKGNYSSTDGKTYTLTVTESTHLAGQTLTLNAVSDPTTYQIESATCTLPAMQGAGIMTTTELMIVKEVYKFTSGYGNLIMYNNGTCEWQIIQNMGTVKGTYTTAANADLDGDVVPATLTLDGNDAVNVTVEGRTLKFVYAAINTGLTTPYPAQLPDVAFTYTLPAAE